LNHGEFVHVAGVAIAFAAETDSVPSNIDHFWITIGMGGGEPIRIALSTHSRQNAAAGFDPRVRVGVVVSTWRELPLPGVLACRGLDYREIEAVNSVTYVEYERAALETLLSEKAGRSIFVEAWGEFYHRNHPGIHQVHSRRASCSVLQDYTGRDGAIRFYFGGDATAEMLLFKYCGQA
jgi:hypothetical protein